MTGNSNILSFNRGAKFYYSKYEKTLEQGSYPDALVFLRQAIAADPKNLDYAMELCRIYSEMELFDISNAAIFDILRRTDRFNAECTFLIGYNCMGLADFEDAQSFFDKYLDEYDDTAFLDDANSYLDMLEDNEFGEEFTDDEELSQEKSVPDEIILKADLGKEALDRGDSSKAIALLEEVLNEYPDVVYAKNNLSLAYYIQERYYEAYKLGQELLKAHPSNIHALCNCAIFASKLENEDLFKKALSDIHKAEPMNIDELFKITMTYCELNLHSSALASIERLLEELPYDARTMYVYAACLSNLGRYSEAKNTLEDIIKVYPNDLVSSYYLTLLRNNEEVLPYGYTLPQGEVLKKLDYLNSCVSYPEEQQRALWNENEKFRSILTWVLESTGDPVLKGTVLNLIGIYGGEYTESLLRKFMVRHNELDPLKDHAARILLGINAKPPYIIYINGRIREIELPAGASFGSDDSSTE